MLPISFNSVLIIAGISVLVPVVLGLLSRLPVPGAVLEVIPGVAGVADAAGVADTADAAGAAVPLQPDYSPGESAVPEY
jgi:hypothetical protein